MSRILSQQVFQLSELSAAAQENARIWFRESSQDDSWYEDVYEDAANIADILGINIRTRIVKLRNGSSRYDDINIGFSGFSSQGDGAHFQGQYRYAKGAAKAIREYAPVDVELHRIADELQAIQSKHFYGIKASVQHSGHYQHENCTDIDVSMTDDRHGNERYAYAELEEKVESILRSFMRWIYRSLEKEYDYQNTDEAVDERMAINGYEFTEEGSRTIHIH